MDVGAWVALVLTFLVVDASRRQRDHRPRRDLADDPDNLWSVTARVGQLDWSQLVRQLDEQGFAVTKPVLERKDA